MASTIVPGWSARNRRPHGPVVLNHDSPLSVGLRRWMTPSMNRLWNGDYGYERVTNVTVGTPTLTPWNEGGVGVLCAGSSVAIPSMSGVSGQDVTVRYVFTPITWPGAFTSWIDDAGRDWSTFIDTSGAISFAGNYWNFGSQTLTTGQRWDLVAAVSGAGSTITYMNGKQTGSRGVGLPNLTNQLELGTNPSTGGTNANQIFETMQVWNRTLSETEVLELYDPATRWQLYWTPSRRVYFDVVATAPAANTTKIIFRNRDYV